MTFPDPSGVLDLIDAFRCSKTMFTAVRMGIFDAIEAAPATLAELAATLGANAAALERLLDGCVGLGFLRKRDGIYENQPAASAYLCRESPATMTGYILYSDQALYPMWGHLEDAVREGSHRWTQTFGFEGPLFNHFFNTGEAMRTFLRGMHGFGLLVSPKIAGTFDLSRFRRFVDLGGATGHLAMAACARYREMRAIVFDLPQVIAFARAENERVEFVPGDFFEDELPPADLYAVSRILHDWSEPKIVRLLEKIYRALPDDGALLVCEKLLAEDKSGPVPALMQSLNMLVVTEGKERTASEYEALLRAAGFRRIVARRTGAPLDAILAEK